MALIRVVLAICAFMLMCREVFSVDSKRILVGDTDYIDSKLRQMEQTMNAKVQAIESKTSNQIHNLTQTIHVLQQQVQETKKHLAFYATLSSHTTLGQKQTVEFDTVITNIGNAYNGISGVFTAPVAGLYQFSTTMLQVSNVPTKTIHTQIMKNNTPIGQNYGNENRASATMNVVVSADKGDIFYVRHHEAATTTIQAIHGSGYSSFSGFLIA